MRRGSLLAGHVRLVGQERAPSKCVLISTSRLVAIFDPFLGGETPCSGSRRASRYFSSGLVCCTCCEGWCGKHEIADGCTMFIIGALHGIEAPFLSQSSLLKLRSALVAAVWSERQLLTHAGSVLSLLGGPEGCDLGFCVVWFRFRMLRRYLAYRSHEVRRVYQMLSSAHDGCP